MSHRGASWLRGALVVVAVAALLGVFNGKATLRRPHLAPLQIAGICVMLLGLAAVVFAGRLAHRFGRDPGSALTAFKLGGLAVCAAGAVLVFI